MGTFWSVFGTVTTIVFVAVLVFVAITGRPAEHALLARSVAIPILVEAGFAGLLILLG